MKRFQLKENIETGNKDTPNMLNTHFSTSYSAVSITG